LLAFALAGSASLEGRRGMHRRQFIRLLGGTAAAPFLSWPLARAQQPAMPIIGYLHASSPETNINFVAAFRKGLSEAGFIEGRNVAIEFRWAAGKDDRLPELAAELVSRRVAAITTPAGTPATFAARSATTTIPCVFAVGGAPIDLGLVNSLSRPGGNITGIGFQTVELTAKRLGILRELAPQVTQLAALVDPAYAFTDGLVREALASAASLGLSI